MLASVYIKDGNIHFYNESRSLTNIGGIAYELGRPLLDFVCYEQNRFEDSFSITASAFDNDFAHEIVKEPELYHCHIGYGNFYLERPFRTFYGRAEAQQVEQLY